ncbi:DeoR/GlpR family DNA-binding transcription regulator [Gordonia rhizosphera]|uniref:Lactose phosphotransferase system repressor n=1 Tax=Gordonia rhizosphera NBRC 16068 TaxID=1108045 RepID=K6VN71_9ACTN|nr:DeoR/GlpR family DNA-binding transcription regulator [Gordonia rhizosphera]GAB88310.1 putative DeoR family transcriptional regulator [Gordonia rhizosphera NBRC 16068]
MYAEERQQAIADQVRANGRASVTALAALFDVTSETVRRDLAALERAGHLQRVHGGAVRPGNTSTLGEQGIDERQMTHTEEKIAIGRAATRFLPPDGGSVFFDAGTTTYQAALALPRDRRLTLITHSIPIAAALATQGAADLHVLGGRVRGLTQATVGSETVAALERLRVSTAFVGANGISESHGLSTPDPDEAAIKAAMVRVANRVVVLCDSSKMDREDLSSFADLADVDVLITDSGIDADSSAALSARGIEVVIA